MPERKKRLDNCKVSNCCPTWYPSECHQPALGASVASTSNWRTQRRRPWALFHRHGHCRLLRVNFPHTNEGHSDFWGLHIKMGSGKFRIQKMVWGYSIIVPVLKFVLHVLCTACIWNQFVLIPLLQQPRRSKKPLFRRNHPFSLRYQLKRKHPHCLQGEARERLRKKVNIHCFFLLCKTILLLVTAWLDKCKETSSDVALSDLSFCGLLKVVINLWFNTCTYHVFFSSFFLSEKGWKKN